MIGTKACYHITCQMTCQQQKQRFKKKYNHAVLSETIKIIHRMAVKGRIIIIPTLPQKKAVDQLHINDVGIEKIRLLVCESIYWINITVKKKTELEAVLYALISRQHTQRMDHVT